MEEIGDIDAVNCTDLYAEQIEAEKNGTWSSNYFTNTFGFDEVDGTQWICPNASILVAELYTSVVPCSSKPDAIYAANTTCADETYQDGLWVFMQLVTTNLASETYFKHS